MVLSGFEEYLEMVLIGFRECMKWTQNSSQKLFQRCSKGLSKNNFNDGKQQVKYDWEQDTIMVRSGF
jgi:hypothetical protein